MSDVVLSIMLLDLGVCLGETAHFAEQIAAFNASNHLRPSDRTFANLQRVRQYMCDWQDWNSSMDKIESLLSSAPRDLTAYSNNDPAKISGDLQIVPPQHALYYPMSAQHTLAAARLCAQVRHVC